MDRVLAIVGVTASGKSALALELARANPGVELVSVDSMQVYREMDIGTAKPTPEQRAEVRHHMIDVIDPADEYTVACFQHDVAESIESIEARGRRPVLVGGTGLYLRAVVDAFQIPGRYPEVSRALKAEPDTARLHEQLRQLDPVAAGRMEPTNRRRVLRALEVTVGSGRPFSSYGPGLTSHPPTRFDLVGVRLPRDRVDARIAERYRHQLAAGFVAEVERLAVRERGLSRTARQALGYRQLLDHVSGRCPLEEAVDAAIAATRRFARRQERWFRRDPRIGWIDVDDNPMAALPRLLRHFHACT